ncbi:hypothetical protein [Rubinisphaera sp. JC750]|uniref:hypothetical protein n=1 Tax=Rubinisphaera sp. JC750 TaxID=2898658 RepID=UPI001F427694|nr:hypothetical protein [Rubinisphaera sp. JC750]
MSSFKFLLPLVLLFTLPLVAVAEEPASGKWSIQYVVLEGGGPDQGPGGNVEENFRALAKRFGPMPAESDRMLAYGVQQLRILSRSTEVVRRDVEQSLDLAEQTGIPVFLHIDSCYGWGADGEQRPEEAPAIKFWQHPKMREWARFPVDDQLPEYIPRWWFNWGPWCSPAPAVPAFGSPAFIEFATSQLDQGVLVPLAARLKKWRSENRSHLFAGINVAWEAHFPDYGEPGFRHLVEQTNGPVRAWAPRSVRGLKMDDDLVGKQLGYASLHWRGWNEKRLREAAVRDGVSRETKFRQICYRSLHDYMEALARACHDRGISADRVYTHIVALATVQQPSTTRPPIWTAVNRYSTPGFTLDNRGAARFDLDKLRDQIQQANGTDRARFGVVETYFRLGDRIYFRDTATCRRELETMFEAGTNLQVFYGCFPLSAGRVPDAVYAALEEWRNKAANRVTQP